MKTSVLAASVLAACCVLASEPTVTKTLRPDGTGDAVTLAEAVAAMGSLGEGETGLIVLEEGEYSVSEPVTVAKAVTIRSASGNPADVTIKASKTLTCRVLFIDHPEARLFGVTVRDGYANGADQNYSAANVTLLQGVVSNCWITSARCSRRSAAMRQVTG